MSQDLGFEIFATTLQVHGPAAALAFLNDGVPHRYSAIYRLRDSVMHCVHLHDKKGEIRPASLQAVPMENSFCQFVLRDGAFRTDDSSSDARLDGHPYQGLMGSYHAVPLMVDDIRMWGTLCHFDTMPMPLAEEMFLLLQRAARLFPIHLGSKAMLASGS